MTDKNILHDYIAGAVGGCAGITVGHPFETVKVQLQTRGGVDRYTGMLDCVRSVQTQTLAKGFFRGLSWPLMSYGAINSVYFGVYGMSLSFFNHQEGADRSVPYYLTILASGCVGGVAQLPIACPVECIKVFLQSQIPHRHGDKTLDIQFPKRKFHKGPVAAATDILKSQGPKGLYRGLGTQFCRDIPASGAYVFTFELLMDTVKTMLPNIPTQIVSFFSGGIAGVMSWLLILPLDVIKSRLQSDPERKMYGGLWDCASKSYRAEGGGTFFRGAVVMSIRAFPVNGVTLMVYSECLKLLRDIQNPDSQSDLGVKMS